MHQFIRMHSVTHPPIHAHIAGLPLLSQTLEYDHWTEGPFALSARPVNILQEVAQ